MEESIQKPIKPSKPTLVEYNLSGYRIDKLNKFKKSVERKARNYRINVFCILAMLGILSIKWAPNGNPYALAYLLVAVLVAAIIAWTIFPPIFKLFTKKELNSYIFLQKADAETISILKDQTDYKVALADYEKKNQLYERFRSRITWRYWLSLNPTEFEDAVAGLFVDNGYEACTTPASGDFGVDILLTKDSKKFVVQCKTSYKPVGPSVARDLYGTMTAEEADGAFLVAPNGFTIATQDFCKGKAITLLDIDDLTKMTYQFENYSSYRWEKLSTVQDFQKEVKKIMREKRK